MLCYTYRGVYLKSVIIIIIIGHAGRIAWRAGTLDLEDTEHNQLTMY